MKNQSVIYITKPGTAVEDFRQRLSAEGYRVKTLNFDNLLQSDSWNPLRYVFDVDDSGKLVDTLFGSSEQGRYLTDEGVAARRFTGASLDFLFDVQNYYDCDKRSDESDPFNEAEVNLKKFVELMVWAKDRDWRNADYVSEWQIHFEALKTLKPNGRAIKLYTQYLEVSKKNLLPGINIAMGVIEPILTPLAQSVFSKDEVRLETLRENGNALLVIRPKWQSNYVPLFNIACQQIVDMLVKPIGKNECHASVHLQIDEGMKEVITLIERRSNALSSNCVSTQIGA